LSRYRCYSLQLNHLLSLSCYKLACYYFLHLTLLAQPLYRSPSSSESHGVSPTPPFPFLAAVGEHRQAGALFQSLSGDFPSASRGVHCGPARGRGPRSVDRVHGPFHCEINQKSRNSIFPGIFAKKPLSFFVINPQSIVFCKKAPGFWKIISEGTLALEKFIKYPPKLQNSISFQPQLQIR
jgi:hypothetical protein